MIDLALYVRFDSHIRTMRGCCEGRAQWKPAHGSNKFEPGTAKSAGQCFKLKAFPVIKRGGGCCSSDTVDLN